VLQIRNKSLGSGFRFGSDLKLVLDPDLDLNPDPTPDSNPNLNPKVKPDLNPGLSGFRSKSEIGQIFSLFLYLKFYPASSSNIKSSVADPDPNLDPPDPLFLSLPDLDPVVRYGSRSFHHAKIV
jgi:hypothetical protein